MIHEDMKTWEKKPIISICIPSYNREKYLKECLDSIINQEGFDQKNIEIIISDNASPDETKKLVNSYQKKYTNIIYHRNDTNIWPIKNILKLVDYANGEYIWFLSDDDMISDIGIETTLEVIRKNNPWLILSNFFGFWNWTKIDTTKINRKGNIINIIWMEKFFDFLATIHYDITPYIMHFSIFCFKKEIYTKNLNILIKENGEEYMEVLKKDYFPHSRIIYIPFGNAEKITIIEKDLVLCRWGNAALSIDPDWVVVQDLWRLIEDFNKNYKMNKKTYHKMKGVYYYSIFLYIVTKYIRKCIPKFLYDWLVYLWRHTIKLIRNIKSKIKTIIK